MIWLNHGGYRMIFVSDLRKYRNIIIIIIFLTAIIFFFQRFNLVVTEIQGDTAIVKINFLVPMKQFGIEEKIHIKSYHLSHSKIHCDFNWESKNVLRVCLKEISDFKGQKAIFMIKGAETKIPFLSKSLSVLIQFQAEPKLIKVENGKNTPTDGPLILQFNTPIDFKNIEQYIQTDVKFEIRPYEVDSNKFIDYCKLVLYPDEKLENERNYLLLIKKGLKAQCGEMIKEDIKIQITTAPKPYITKTFPEQSAKWVSIYPKITAEMSEELSDAIVTIDGVKQKVKIKGNKLELLPWEVLRANKEYEVQIQGVSKYGEKTDLYSLKFTTMPLKEDQLWVEVVLKEKHEVLIHKGEEVIRRMPASGGKPEEPSVLGTFYIQDRGPSFFSPRFNEGALYWVRIVDQYLFHGIPRDNHGNIIQSELEKIGKPASHGCIRLLDEDAKWFYENIPHGTMVIIHE